MKRRPFDQSVMPRESWRCHTHVTHPKMSVSLLVPGAYIGDEATESDAYTCKAGGSPQYLGSALDQPVCSHCQAPLSLLTQIYAPAEGNARQVLLFACTQSDCSKTARAFVFRSSQPDSTSDDGGSKAESAPITQTQSSKEEVKAEPSTVWIADQDDWGDKPDTPITANIPTSVTQSGLPASQAEAIVSDGEDSDDDGKQYDVIAEDTSLSMELDRLLKLREEQQQHPQLPTNSQTQSHSTGASKASGKSQSFYLIWQNEPEKADYSMAHEMELLRRYQESEEAETLNQSGDAGGGGGGDDEYEQAFKGSDKILRKFVKKLDRCPEQCVRYDFDGKALWMSDQVPANIPRCPHCQSERVLEFQAMPHLFHSLRLSTVDWGVISTYVCPASCQIDCFAEEFVFIQPSV